MIWDGDVGSRGIHIEHTIQMGRKVTIIGIGRWPSCSWRQCFCNLPYFDVCSTMNACTCPSLISICTSPSGATFSINSLSSGMPVRHNTVARQSAGDLHSLKRRHNTYLLRNCGPTRVIGGWITSFVTDMWKHQKTAGQRLDLTYFCLGVGRIYCNQPSSLILKMASRTDLN